MTPAAAAAPPVFVQTMWRSSGTYVWSKFREQPHFHAYFEPCSEWLAASSAAAIERGSRRHRTGLRHTGVTAQYFAEFPFAASGGVPHYQRRFAFEDYYLDRDAFHPDFERYLAFLIDHARTGLRTPVLKCCRYGLRSAWLDRVFAPVMIYVVRNPDAIFRSFWSFGERRSYFLAASILIVSKNRNAEPFRELAGVLSIPPLQGATIIDELLYGCEIVSRLSPDDLRAIVLLLWALNIGHNSRIAPLFLDVDLLATDRDYGEATADRLTELVGGRLRFDDAVVPARPEAPGRVLTDRGVAITRNALRALRPPPDWNRVQVSGASAAVIDAVA
jgi:hypothetical protein